MLDLHAFLKFREAGDPVFERNNFTIGDEGIGLLPMKRCCQLRVFLVQPDSVPRKEAQFAAAAKNKAALAVPLRLKQPSFSRKAFVRKCRQHGCNPFRLRSLAKQSFSSGRQPVQSIAVCHGIPPLNSH